MDGLPRCTAESRAAFGRDCAGTGVLKSLSENCSSVLHCYVWKRVRRDIVVERPAPDSCEHRAQELVFRRQVEIVRGGRRSDGASSERGQLLRAYEMHGRGIIRSLILRERSDGLVQPIE
ncbi:hypothetical protein ACFPRL_17180 [Pseudoclavibacter helvolus]